MLTRFIKTSITHKTISEKYVFKGVVVRSNSSYPDDRESELPPTTSRPSRSTSQGYPYIHIRRSPFILVIQVQTLAPMGGSDGLEPKCTTNESALRVGYGLTVIRWGSPVPLLPLPAFASHAIR